MMIKYLPPWPTEVIRNGTAISNGNLYTPVKADRIELSLYCKDTAHPYWKGENTALLKTFRPQCKFLREY